MPTYERFEDLPVWQAAARLYDLTDEFLTHAPRRLSASFRDQLGLAVLSASNNIAEGFERGTTNELLQFLYIARGSAGEVRSMLQLLLRRSAHEQSEISNFKSEITKLMSQAESCSRQLRGWADSLQNSDIKGPRHLNDQSRRSYTERSRAANFTMQIQENFRRDHPELFPPDSPPE
jgi:four helix bundle protein